MSDIKHDNTNINVEYFRGKKIKCSWCLNYGSSSCSVKGSRVKGNKRRKCQSFNPDESALRKEAEKGANTKVIKRPDWYWMRRRDVLKLAEKQREELLKAVKQDNNHPLTGDLNRFRTTAGD